MGNVVTYFLISFLAMDRDLLVLIIVGASFQILNASLRKVAWLFRVEVKFVWRISYPC